jgi:pheromone shutdown protein TraB
MQGIKRYLEQGVENPKQMVAELDSLPAPKKWPKFIPWIIVALILSGFAIGFSRSSELGWNLVVDWVLINGGLSALGALIAGAHPLTTIAAFVAAPLTSLNPTVGAGMATAAVEIYLRKPRVGDFSELRHDTTHLKGWWHNRVSRTLLVFLFSTLGSAVGTYVAGFKIFGQLAG